MEDTMRPTTAFDDNVFDLNALLHPGTVFDHPRDVLSHPSLSISEKRAILASWASDASAIASCPALRAPQGLKAPVVIDEILEALCELDGGSCEPPGGKPNRLRSISKFPGRLVGEGVMDEIRLPQHVVSRLERRWAARFGRRPESTHPTGQSFESREPGSDDPLQSTQVRRLLEGSLRPPKREGSVGFGQA
jgi:hypothetical protein